METASAPLLLKEGMMSSLKKVKMTWAGAGEIKTTWLRGVEGASVSVNKYRCLMSYTL